jgi:hypothetical protein
MRRVKQDRWIGGFREDGELCQVFADTESANSWLRSFKQFGHYLQDVVVCLKPKRKARR